MRSKSMEEIQNEMIQLGVYALVVRGEGQDLLMGKNVHNYISIPGLESLLQLFIVDLDRFFDDIYKGDIPSYLKKIESKFHLDLSFLASNLTQNIEEMKKTDSEEIMIYYLVITKTLEHIRQIIFNKMGNQAIKDFYEAKTGKSITKQVQNQINRLDDESDEDLSLLYNLIFIQFLTEIYQKENLLKKINQVIDERLENFFQKLNKK